MDHLHAPVADRRHSVNHQNQPRLAGEAEGGVSFVVPAGQRLKMSKRRGRVDCNSDIRAWWRVNVCAL
jgi:hypothetical protein